MSSGFIKLQRNVETWEVLKDKNAFLLLTVIALRARRNNDFNKHDLLAGQALLGDYRNYGLSEQQYRTAKHKLQRWGFATFKATNRGTVATLTDTRIYDAHIEDEQRTEQQSGNGQTTTNKNEKNYTSFSQPKKKYGPKSLELRLAILLFDLIKQRKTDYKRPNLQKWAVHIDRMLRIDKRNPEKIEEVITWSQQDLFWQDNILSVQKLRERFDQLELRMNKSCQLNGESKLCRFCSRAAVDYTIDNTGQKCWICRECYSKHYKKKGLGLLGIL